MVSSESYGFFERGTPATVRRLRGSPPPPPRAGQRKASTTYRTEHKLPNWTLELFGGFKALWVDGRTLNTPTLQAKSEMSKRQTLNPKPKTRKSPQQMSFIATQLLGDKGKGIGGR